MNWLSLSFRNLAAKKYQTALNIVLLALGTGIMAMILLTATQVGTKLAAGDQGVDAVVGAKGSPLQLILSSIYHIDFPTGNISLKDAEDVMNSPMVREAVPLSLGDAYGNFRIVGTTHQFVRLYELGVEKGRLWKEPFEACVGAHVARIRRLKVGDHIVSSHGLTADGHAHGEHPYTVTGIFEENGTVADNLVLTSTESVWAMHGLEAESCKATWFPTSGGLSIPALRFRYSHFSNASSAVRVTYHPSWKSRLLNRFVSATNPLS